MVYFQYSEVPHFLNLEKFQNPVLYGLFGTFPGHSAPTIRLTAQPPKNVTSLSWGYGLEKVGSCSGQNIPFAREKMPNIPMKLFMFCPRFSGIFLHGWIHDFVLKGDFPKSVLKC